MYLPIILLATLLLPGVAGEEDFFDAIVKLNRRGEVGLFASGKTLDVTLMEGDIVVNSKFLQDVGIMRRSADNGLGMFDAITSGQWKGRVGGKVEVPYYVRSPSRKMRAVIAQAVKAYSDSTCIRWKEYSRNGIKGFKNSVTFINGAGCYSMIGRQSRPQEISLQVPGCTNQIGTVIHEMMHALGFFHEQSRLDRDNFISINWGNIQRSMWYNFQKYRPGQANTLGAAYDKQSVMHYGPYSFSVNRRKTIVSKSNSNEKLGQRKGLSKIDIEQLNKYYRCPIKKTKVCPDKFNFCTMLSKVCKQYPWVQENCKDTCNQCRRPKKRVCVNLNNNCKGWQGKNFCRDQRYASYMQKNCRKACRFCTS